MEMCFARQGHAPFRHPNFQNWPNSFWLRAVLRATTERTFSASDLAKVVWEWCVLSILAWTCASRRNSVQVFVSHFFWPHGFAPAALAPTLRLSQHFARLYLLSSDSDSFSRLFFSLLPLSSLWLFPSLLFISPYCRKFDLKTRFGTVLYR